MFHTDHQSLPRSHTRACPLYTQLCASDLSWPADREHLNLPALLTMQQSKCTGVLAGYKLALAVFAGGTKAAVQACARCASTAGLELTM